MRDLHHNIGIVQTLLNAVYAADQNGQAVDRQGFESIEHLAVVGNSADALAAGVKIDLRLQHSDDNLTWLNVTSALDVFQSTVAPYVPIDGNGIFVTIDAPAEDSTVFAIGYRGAKRYSRLVADFTGSHANGTPIALLAIKGHPASAPVAGT